MLVSGRCVFFWREDWDPSIKLPSHSSSRGNGRCDGSTQGRCGRRKEDKATLPRANLKAGGLEMMFHWWVKGLRGFVLLRVLCCWGFCAVGGFVSCRDVSTKNKSECRRFRFCWTLIINSSGRSMSCCTILGGLIFPSTKRFPKDHDYINTTPHSRIMIQSSQKSKPFSPLL